jgi:hypothetical protein
MTDEAIYPTAAQLVIKHGLEAPIHAASKVDEMLAKGDLEARDTWRQILKAVDELLAIKREGTIH